MTNRAQSPASSGPAGAHFEAQVAAHYLLSLLAHAAPRGLPGTHIKRIEFQRAGEGYHLDDIIVHAHDSVADSVLEIQVKRTITFAPSDPVFRTVVQQIARSSQKPEFDAGRYHLAIATARTSTRIEQAYKDVLTWARQLGDSETFLRRIERPGSANEAMRRFVQTFKSHLSSTGVSTDSDTVWSILRRLHILVFDFAAGESVCQELARERAVRVLHAEDASRADELWSTLLDLSLTIASSGGDRDRNALLNDLAEKSFRLAGSRHYASARAAVAEASDQALADIGDHIGDVRLARYPHVVAVQQALNNGRYVEIRGDAGVGKSAILKHFAEQIREEAQVLVLSPSRTPTRGWTAMRATLGFDGSARDLLSDMASGGGAILFVDNLDHFTNEEQTTVRDLVGEAAHVPGVAVVSTARHEFATDEPNWLPREALSRLGIAPPVEIGALSDSEVDELRSAAPSLVPLLDESHPARAVTRNLFRLARLASLRRGDPVPHTEVEMADQWWRTADGRRDGQHRVRCRVLKKMAIHALSDPAPVDVSDQPADAVDALINSQSLRDLGNDKVAFRHDVLLEWAVANLLFRDRSLLQELPLQQSSPAALARGVELAARMSLEKSADSHDWRTMLERLSRDDIHESWSRYILLALVRSEIASDLLTRTTADLFSDRARILRKLIRIVLAVEVRPAKQVFPTAITSAVNIPDSVNVPTGPSCIRLLGWLLSHGVELPPSAIPDIVEIYTTWSVGLFGQDDLTPLILLVMHGWLTEIETAHETRLPREFYRLFGGELDSDQLRKLESDLRTYFALFCFRAPALAARYLRALIQRNHNEQAVRSILRSSSAFAQAAPSELAKLTVAALIPERDADKRNSRHRRSEPFTWFDRDLLPASPAQGPFFQLLTHDPEEGLTVVRRLVEHAVKHCYGDRESGNDSISIVLDGELRAFPWAQTYNWSRQGAGYHCLNSALMALEAWGHRRIESGDEFEDVLTDVLGPPGSSAAYLLVAVDLIISHWPLSREPAIPFVASPELLSLDQERKVYDDIGTQAFVGIKYLRQEPAGPVDLDSLNKRPSRRYTLNDMLGMYAISDSIACREKLRTLLRDASVRIGEPNADMNLRDPALMAVHALNLSDPDNWTQRSIIRPDGSRESGHQYVSPQREARHFTALQESVKSYTENTTMRARLSLAVEDPSDSSPEFAATAVHWAQDVQRSMRDEEQHADRMLERAIVTAAMIAMRDGDGVLHNESAQWANSVLLRTLSPKDDQLAHRSHAGLRYNEIAIAFLGVFYGVKRAVPTLGVAELLRAVASGNTAAAYGLRATAKSVDDFDERLPRALLRCALASCIRPKRRWNTPAQEIERLLEIYRARMQDVVNAEIEWLGGKTREPDWPEFPPLLPRSRPAHGITDIEQNLDHAASEEPTQEEYADHQAASRWLNAIGDLLDVSKNPWIREIVRNYSAWTFSATGAHLDSHADIDGAPREWNSAYLHVMARSLPGLSLHEAKELAIKPICSLPDEPFFDCVPSFLGSLDEVYFNDRLIETPTAVAIRSEFASRLATTGGWHYIDGKRGASVESHIGPAIASLFFGQTGFGRPPQCYLIPETIERLEPFLPVLAPLVKKGSCVFVAALTLNMMEVSPTPAHLRFVIQAASVWLKSFSEYNEFWVDYSIGRRLCAWFEDIWRQDPTILAESTPSHSDVERLLAALVGLGVPEARQLEQSLSEAKSTK